MASPSLLWRQLRVAGPHWLYRRLAREWSMPTTRLGRVAYGLRNPSLVRPLGSASATTDTLYAFYDLGVAPITFDFLWFLVGADIARRSAQLAKVHVVIVPGPSNGFRDENPAYDAAIDVETRQARVSNVLIPACTLLPSMSGVTLASSRDQAGELATIAGERIFPTSYSPAMPRYEGTRSCLEFARVTGGEIAVLRSTAYSRLMVERWLETRAGARRVVTITLRQYAYLPERNSDLAAWAGFARAVAARGYFPVVIPDTEQILAENQQPLQGLELYHEAAWNLGLRMALYERAYMNLGVNNGPLGLCWLNAKTRYLTFKILAGNAPQVTKEYMEYLGFPIGESLPFATPFQRWIWQPDDEATITREFDLMAARIDNAASTG